MRDYSDLSANTVKIDYEKLKEVAYQSVAAHRLLMEDYRKRIENALEDIYQESHKDNNPTAILRHTISAKMNVEHLLEQTKMYHDSICLLHIVLGAMNREEVIVVNTPLNPIPVR